MSCSIFQSTRMPLPFAAGLACLITALPVYAEPPAVASQNTDAAYETSGTGVSTVQHFELFSDSGNLVLQGSMLDGEKHGEFKEYAESGQLVWRGYYVRGRLHGTVEKWHANGEPASHWEFENGRAVGVAEKYTVQGALAEKWDFSQSKCSGHVDYTRFSQDEAVETGTYVDKSLRGSAMASMPSCGWANLTKAF